MKTPRTLMFMALMLCSLGAAGKRDPGQLRTGDVFDSRVCPLAKKVRQKLRLRGLGTGQVRAVWSLETPVGPVAVAPGQEPADEPRIQRRQPSNMMLPGMFSGWLQEWMGYQAFFVWVLVATVTSFVVTMMIPLDASFGKKDATTA